MNTLFKGSTLTRFVLMPFMLLAMLIALNGCGDKEPQQRKAFIDFLQTRVIAKPQMAVPQLTEADKKAFGPYADHYAVITDFHKAMNEEMNGSLAPAFISLSDVGSVDKLLAKRDQLQKMSDDSTAWQQKLVQLRADTDKKHAALKQPDDLKAVYDRAYDKVIVQPDILAEQVFTLLPKVLTLVVAKADFIKSQGNNVKIIGNTVQFSDQQTLDKFNEIQKQLQPLIVELTQVSSKMQQLVR